MEVQKLRVFERNRLSRQKMEAIDSKRSNSERNEVPRKTTQAVDADLADVTTHTHEQLQCGVLTTFWHRQKLSSLPSVHLDTMVNDSAESMSSFPFPTQQRMD